MTFHVRRRAAITALMLTLVTTACKKRQERPTAASSRTDPTSSLDVGEKFCLSGIEPTHAKQTLILFVEDSCPACSVSENLLGAFRLRAVRDAIPVFIVKPSLQRSSDESHRDQLGAATFVIGRGKNTGIKRVPTVLLLDDKGIVTRLWTGGADPGAESKAVKDFFDGNQSTAQSLKSIDLEELAALRHKKSPFQLVSITTSKGAGSQKDLLPGELSIPAQDLAVREKYELDRRGFVILDCRATNGLQCQDSIISLQKLGYEHIAGLNLGHLGQSPACESYQ